MVGIYPDGAARYSGIARALPALIRRDASLHATWHACSTPARPPAIVLHPDDPIRTHLFHASILFDQINIRQSIFCFSSHEKVSRSRIKRAWLVD